MGAAREKGKRKFALSLFFFFLVRSFSIGHFRVPPGLCIKTRLGAQPLI